ncbi:hypothetical protein Q4Q57_20660 [Shewanella sp. SP2S2-6]|uniref:hypothetical protein n=1 Tax=Shewanella sp. SP2S2-6 TaxID=3063540 RepID=UPI00288E7F89|nr:hypothetical protein [Shewanella sp. SP2S2-6]MDT3297530.1 hypothetical protein [Shewanella sp. SP2S2-6]
MTQQAYLYTDDLEWRSDVISCIEQQDKTYHVILSSTIFHPRGGGQSADQGSIGEAKMLSAFQENDKVVHVTDRRVLTGETHLCVDRHMRSLNSRYHSAGHLIAVVGEKYGWVGIKGNHVPNEARVVLEPTENSVEFTAEQLQADVLDLISMDLDRIQQDSNGLKYVSWGALPLTTCGGTHVVSTSEVGCVTVLKVKKKKGRISISYSVGSE